MGGLGNNGFGGGFPFFRFGPDEALKRALWAKGRIILGRDPAEWRMDVFGSFIRYDEYGQYTSYGWEKDHIDPNGPEELWNLQPLYWLNNRRKSDKTPLTLALEALGILSRSRR